MGQVEAEMGRCVALLRNKIRRRGFTPQQVQDSLGWGRKISRLVKKPKTLQMRHLLLVLDVIGVEPADFFGELYGGTAPPAGRSEGLPALIDPSQAMEYPPRPRDSPHTIARYRLEVVCAERIPMTLDHQHCAGPGQIAAFLKEALPKYAQEIMGSLFLDIRNYCIGYTISYLGTISALKAEPRGLLLPALLANATGVVVFHTHPSGDPSPSKSDWTLTKQFAEAAEILGLSLVDHIILGQWGLFHSMAGDREWPGLPRFWDWGR